MSTNDDLKLLADRLDRLIGLIERAVPPAAAKPDFAAADAFVWLPASHGLEPVARVNRVDIGLLKGIDRVRDIPPSGRYDDTGITDLDELQRAMDPLDPRKPARANGDPLNPEGYVI